jgi:DNA ligase-4
MPDEADMPFESSQLLHQFHDHGLDVVELPGWMFHGLVVYFDQAEASMADEQKGDANPTSDPELDISFASQVILFTGGRVSEDIDNPEITHVVVGEDRSTLKYIREQISRKSRLPRIVTLNWVRESWKEKTLLDEESEFSCTHRLYIMLTFW